MSEAANTIAVSGMVAEPRAFTRDDLAALPQVTRTTTFVNRGGAKTTTYTGPTLNDVIKAAGGVVEPKRLDRLRAYVIARSATGYEVVLSWGEIDALFGNGPFLVAHESNDPAAVPDEVARLVAPADEHGGRYVGQLVELEVCTIPSVSA